jgi:hypothetical protein
LTFLTYSLPATSRFAGVTPEFQTMNTSNAAMRSSIRYAKSSSEAAINAFRAHEQRKEENTLRETAAAEEARLYKIFEEFCYLRHMTVQLESGDDDLMTPKSLSGDTLGYIEENLSRLLGEIVEINKSRDNNIPISAYATFHQWSIVYALARKNQLARPILSSIEEHLIQALNTMMAANKL